MTSIDEWLNAMGLGKYQKAFADAEIDLIILPHLTESDLSELGLPIGPRRKVIAAIEALNGTTKDPVTLSGAERRQLIIMFVDLVGSTALSVKLDPEDMSEVIVEFQKTVSSEVVRFGGNVAKFLGDGVLIYFGWPVTHEDAAECAINAGLATAEAVGRLSAADQPLAVRVGVATGPVVVGETVGEGSAKEEIVVGATPNLAARLQEVAEAGSVVVSESTRQLLSSRFELEDLGKQNFKGLSSDIGAYRVIGERTLESRFAARTGSSASSLVGRSEEMSALKGHWCAAARSSGRLLLIEGEAGIGKSHLMQAFDETLPDAHRKLVWQCSPSHSESPLWPAIQQIVRAVGIDATFGLGETLDRLKVYLDEIGADRERLLPHLAGLLGFDGQQENEVAPTTPLQKRADALLALVELLQNLAIRAPVLLLIEDAHWIDPTTLELVGMALDTLRDQRILVLITTRPGVEFGHKDHPLVFHLSLHRLDPNSVAEIVHRVSQDTPLSRTLIEEITQRTDGVPLFVEEMTKAVLEAGLLKETDAGWTFEAPISQIPIPATLQDTLMARLDRLGPSKEIAQLAAIIGRDFERSILARLTAASPERLNVALEMLLELGIIHHKLGENEVFIFKHAIVRDAAYKSLLRRHRRKFHLRLLDILEKTQSHMPEILARHAETGGDLSRAISWRVEAGSNAVARGNFEEAEGHLHAAETLLRQIDDPICRKRFAASVSIARSISSLVQRGHGHDATGLLFEQSIALAKDAEDPMQVVAAGYGVWAYYYVHGDVVQALEVAERLAEAGKVRSEPTISGLASSLIGIAQTMAGQLSTARATMINAHSVIPAGAAERLRAQVGFDLAQSTSSYLAWVELVSGLATRSRTRAQLAQGSLGDRQEVNGRAFKLSHAGALAAERGEFVRVGQVGDEMLALCKAHGLEFWESFGHTFAGWRLLSEGRTAQAVDHLEIAYVEMRLRGGGLLGALIPGLLAEAIASNGDARALDIIRDAEAEADKMGRHFGRAETLRRHGRVLASLLPKAPNAAEAMFRKALEIANEQGAVLWEIRASRDLARLLAGQDRRAEAQHLLASTLRRWQDALQPVDVTQARTLLQAMGASLTVKE
ncbi:adenylate/guanylate cyclase domain-containing protein [Sedimentitalea sp.]|uniref:AAA family ATPase n=1 Tax=Sedimentitalea sp. TaxID=2048915 RepID=UPI0032992966